MQGFLVRGSPLLHLLAGHPHDDRRSAERAKCIRNDDPYAVRVPLAIIFIVMARACSTSRWRSSSGNGAGACHQPGGYRAHRSSIFRRIFAKYDAFNLCRKTSPRSAVKSVTEEHETTKFRSASADAQGLHKRRNFHRAQQPCHDVLHLRRDCGCRSRVLRSLSTRGTELTKGGLSRPHHLRHPDPS